MKKLLILLLITPIISFAQLKTGRYFIRQAHNGKYIQYNLSATLMLADACADFSCRTQYFDITAVAGTSKIYTIKNVQTGKYLTFSDLDAYETTAPAIKLEPLRSGANKRFQQFLINSDKDNIYSIHPNKITGTLEVFLATEMRDINSGGTLIGFEYKTPDRNPANYANTTNVTWNFMPIPNATVSRTSISTPVVADRTLRSPSVIVEQPSSNKLDIDFKTGADNLEMKPFQENVEIRIIVRNKADVILLNANKGQSWPNNSIKRVTVPLPANITVDELREIHVYRNRKNGGTPTTTIFNISEKDNWNLEKITATARIKENGVLKTYRFADLPSPVPGRPLFRFVYEGGDGRSEGQVFKGSLSNVGSGSSTNTSANATNARPVFKIATLTGGDDLRGGNDNLNVLIRLKIRPVRNIALNNINNGEKWSNFTEKTVTKTITAAAFTFDDIEDIVLRHTGGRGTGADDWYLDKLKITLTIAGETRVLVDEVAAPIHYFSGDNRSKIFTIIR
ncbi:hypothetical protein SAMN05421820_104170 [Pedobacter steynii]|uniref:Uncharacterized protein n=1 Tax=Pedobacter steynii TaxID=430522 RepID=A0A1G9UI14_9SPHI|nr:RICIN domain-containing protein [Pedobacter steynii]NQX40764.1 RICIN domain-containing protein [Pedobacter steynii]SDM59185.1 hypothetical protein SAMN05421820_104170 [Pedobacter steynii]